MTVMFDVRKFERMTAKVPLRQTVDTYVIDYPGQRRAPGGLTLAVLFAVGDGYDTSQKIADLLDTSIDNVNGALSRLAQGHYVNRWGTKQVQWTISNAGRVKLRCELAEGTE